MEGIFKKDKTGSGGGGKVKEVALLSITTAPTGEFAKGSKYYNLTDKKIYTAVVANSWDGATVDDPQFGTYYLYNNTTYIWDGDSLEKYNLEDFIPKTDIVNDLETNDSTKVLSAEQGQVLKQEVDTKNPILEIDNIINENSYNVVSNKGIAEGIKAKTTNVVDDIVDVLPTADTLDKKVLLTTDNKIYKTTYGKKLNTTYVVGNLVVDNTSVISNFGSNNYINITSDFWPYLFPLRISLTTTLFVQNTNVPIIQLYVNGNKICDLSLIYENYGSINNIKVAVYRDNFIIQEETYSGGRNFFYNNNLTILAKMNNGFVIFDLYRNGKYIKSFYMTELNTTNFSLMSSGQLKVSNNEQDKGIQTLDGNNSYFYNGGYSVQRKVQIIQDDTNLVWQEELTCQKDSKIIDLASGQILVYNNNIWTPVADIPVIDINSLSQLNSLLTSIHSKFKLCINITAEFSNNYNPEFKFKEGLAVMMIQTPQKATIVGANFSAYYTDGKWVGTNTNIEEITFGTVSGGFDNYLRLNDLQLNSTDGIIHLFQDEELFIDLGPNWETNFDQSFYMYCQPFGFIINGQATKRHYVINNRAGRFRLACKTNTNFNEVNFYKRKNINFIKTELKNDTSFNVQTILFYGDSISAGYTNSTPAKVDNPYPNIFLTAVNAVDAENSNKSISGSSYTNINGRTKLLDTIRGNDPDNPADITSTHIFIAGGINDFAEQIDPNVFRDAVRETFDYIHEHNSRASVFIISPLNINTANSTWQKPYKVDVYRNILEQESYRYGFYYINGAEFPLPIQSSYLYTDNLHISQTAHNIVGLQLLYKLTKDIVFNNDILFLHNNDEFSFRFTGKTTTDGKLIYKYTVNPQNKSITNIINILQFTGIQVSNIYMLRAYGYAGDASYRVPLGWISNANVDYYFSAHLGVNGDINYHLPTANYTNFEITFEFWME